MNHKIAVLGLFVLATLIAGTAGFDIVQSDRSVDVFIAADDDAYLRITTDGTVINQTTETVLTAENQFGTSVDVEFKPTVDSAAFEFVEVTDSDESVSVSDGGSAEVTLDTDESGELRARCTEAGKTATIEVDLKADGSGIAVDRAPKSFAVSCEASS